MPVVRMKRIFSVSSEDEIHCSSNLLSPSVGLQWLSKEGDRAKSVEVEIELAKLSKVKQIEIGNMGSAFVEVLVKSSLMEKETYLSLLPQSMLMSAEESRSSRNLTRTKLFSPDKLSKTAFEKKWLCVKVVCLQPFNTSRQFGLRFIKFYSHSPAEGQETTPSIFPELVSSPQLASLLSSPKVNSTTPPRYSAGCGPVLNSPNVPSLTNHKQEPRRTPVKRKVERCDQNNDEFEFSGLEKQSRLLKNTLKNDLMTIKNNPILSRIAAERGFKGKEEEKGSGFIRKKLLMKELPKAEGVDFLTSYKEDKGKSQAAKLYSMLKVSNMDDSSEMGEDPIKGVRERKKRNNGGKKTSGKWLNSRRKAEKRDVVIDEDCFPEEFDTLPLHSTEQKSLDDYFYQESTRNKEETICIEDEDDGGVINLDEATIESDKEKEGLGKCPVCGAWLPLYVVEMHASECAEKTYDITDTCSSAGNEVIWCN